MSSSTIPSTNPIPLRQRRYPLPSRVIREPAGSEKTPPPLDPAMGTWYKSDSLAGDYAISRRSRSVSKMTRTDLIDAIAKECGTEKRPAKLFLEGFTTIVERTMKKGGEVPLAGLGKFKVVKRKARMGRNPATGQT